MDYVGHLVNLFIFFGSNMDCNWCFFSCMHPFYTHEKLCIKMYNGLDSYGCTWISKDLTLASTLNLEVGPPRILVNALQCWCNFLIQVPCFKKWCPCPHIHLFNHPRTQVLWQLRTNIITPSLINYLVNRSHYFFVVNMSI